MAASSEEDDYMSDAFLTKTLETDIRPGLVKSHKIARKNRMEAKKAKVDTEQSQSKKQSLEQTQREIGLSSAISSENKGFAMLAKMGYKQGDAIGRTATGGIVEPIAVQVKSGRSGFGRESALKELEEYKERLRRAKSEMNAANAGTSLAEFRQRMAHKTSEKQLESDLFKCQRACEKLDLDASVDKPAMKWFWPSKRTNAPDASPVDPYDNVTRTKRKYSTSESSTDDEGEGSSERVGSSKATERFGEFKESSDSEDSDESDKNNLEAHVEEMENIEEDDEDDDDFELSDKLSMVTKYLRTNYLYCHWCGVQYTDSEDMSVKFKSSKNRDPLD